MSKRKTAIVTGASRGIGKAIAQKLAKENFNVIIFGRNEKKLKAVKNNFVKFGISSDYYSGDVADEKFVNQSVADIIKKYKNIDVLINNAGVAIFELFTESTLENFKTQIDANLIGVYNFSKSVINGMIKKQSGAIINIVSQAGKSGFAYGSTYAATKHAVMGLSKSLMLEVRKHNIKVMTVCPGSTETEMIENSHIQKNIKQVLKPNDVAEIVYAAIKLPQRALVSDLEIRPNNP